MRFTILALLLVGTACAQTPAPAVPDDKVRSELERAQKTLKDWANLGLFRIFGAVMVPALKGIGLRVRRAAHALAEAETQHVRTSRA